MSGVLLGVRPGRYLEMTNGCTAVTNGIDNEAFGFVGTHAPSIFLFGFTRDANLQACVRGRERPRELAPENPGGSSSRLRRMVPLSRAGRYDI